MLHLEDFLVFDSIQLSFPLSFSCGPYFLPFCISIIISYLFVFLVFNVFVCMSLKINP
jgi:hypothetical protein